MASARNSFSRIGVYERTHGDWSLSTNYTGTLPDTRYMDIDSAASTPILHLDPALANVQYLRYELTALAYHLKEQRLEAKEQRLGAGGSRLGRKQGLEAGASVVQANGSQPPASSLQPPSSQPPGFTALVIWLALSGFSLDGRSLGLGLLAGLGGGAGLALFYRALSVGTMSIVSPVVA